MVQAKQFEFSMVMPGFQLIEAPKKMARPLDSLNGKVIGALWNGRSEGDVILGQILEILVERYGVKDTHLFRKIAVQGSAPKEKLDEWAKQVDAFVTGIGN